MQKNVTGQKIRVFAFDKTTNNAKTGDAANITMKIAKDWGTRTAITDTNPTEAEDGYYEFDATQTESNANVIDTYPESSTADIQVIGVPGQIVTTPANYSAMGIESDGDLTKVNLVATTTANSDMRGTDSAALATALSTVDSNVSSILTDTAEIGTAGAGLSNINLPNQVMDITGNLSGSVGSVTAEVTADAVKISGNSVAADKLEASAETIETGAAEAGTLSVTQMSTNLTEATNDHYNGRSIIWTSGALLRQASAITDYVGSGGILTFNTVTSIPNAGDTFVIV